MLASSRESQSGWTSYPPLSALFNAAPGSGTGQTLWLVGVTFVGVSSMMGSVNYLTTILTMRAPGMKLFRMPMTVWAMFITALLQADDRLIEECGTVAEALARLNAAAYDLIVLDYRLPDASGLAVMDWLLSHDRRESVIMISAEQSVEAAVGALRRGAADFLVKPYSAEQLRRSVAKTLAKRQTERSRRQTRQRLESSEQMHRYLVENSLDLIYTLDADGRFSYLNQRIESLLGHPRSALLGKHFSEIVYPEDLERARFSFNERRTGPRATSNLALRLTRNPFGNVENDEHGPVSIVLNAMGIYNRTDSRAAIHYAGTYGAARSLPGYRLHEQGHGDHCFHDPLTHLPNRDLFCDRLNLSIAQAKRRKTHIAVMFIDMDRFKLVNDTYGQGEGDTLLRAVATRLRQCLRKGDSLTRHGSDEFLVLLPDVGTKADATAIADKILQAFRNPFPVVDGEFTATISLGAALHPEDGDSADDLIQHASVAMHQVKGSGGNAFSFFSPDMHATYRARISLEKELHLALSRKELELHYQPLISLSRGAITGMEALVRWRHPQRGFALRLHAQRQRLQALQQDPGVHRAHGWAGMAQEGLLSLVSLCTNMDWLLTSTLRMQTNLTDLVSCVSMDSRDLSGKNAGTSNQQVWHSIPPLLERILKHVCVPSCLPLDEVVVDMGQTHLLLSIVEISLYRKLSSKKVSRTR